MILNFYILIFLYVITIFIFIFYYYNNVKNKLLHNLKSKINYLYFTTFIGIIYSSIISFNNSNFFSQHTFVDVTRVLNFSTIFALPFVFSFIKKIYFKLIYKYLFIFALLYTFLICLSCIFGTGESIFYGGIFGATTVNLGIISLFFFIALNDYLEFKKFKSLILLILTYFVILITLTKWNILVLITGIYFIYLLVIMQLKVKSFLKYIFIILLIIAIAYLIYNGRQIFDLIAQLNDFDDFDSYLNGRVFRKMTSDSQVDSGIGIMIGDDYGIKDGARFLVWLDLITKTMKSPFTGVGLGIRAFGEDMEDHSMFIFFFARFGIIFFLFFYYKIFNILKEFYKIYLANTNKQHKIIFILFFTHIFFQASVGNIWGQLPYDIFIGVFLSKLLFDYKTTND